MALEMRRTCEKCGRRLEWQSDAFICSFEYTYCVDCAEDLNWTCRECGGELAPRPRRLQEAPSQQPTKAAV